MKIICKNIAFSKHGKCLLGEGCICQSNKLWLEITDESQDEIINEFMDYLIENYYGQPEASEMEKHIRENYIISRK